ncbi:hypothetical protein [uncultured Planktosalinus sp.]|uniref:hypothetical protein n=1 Tax=uncultured Planktosalinus sp. TaxID=1810935 RepID=UPI0030D970A5|tara:strand:- start:447 stop:950 length:504 start_codon:yes stop_codon:yes gene_type:complete
MRNILMILVVVVTAMTSCNNDKQVLSNSFDTLQKESDSLLQVHTALKSSHSNHLNNYTAITENMAGMTLQDSSWLETLATQQVILKNHEAQIQKVELMLNGHQELKANFPNLTTEEMQAQIDVMTTDLEEIKKSQTELTAEHQNLEQQLAQISEGLKKQTLTAEAKQ